MFNRCKTSEELAIILQKIISLAESTSKKTKSVQGNSSAQMGYETYYTQSNKDNEYGIDMDELIAQ